MRSCDFQNGRFSSRSFISEKKLLDSNIKFRNIIFPDKFIDQDKPENMYKSAGMDSENIAERVLEIINSKIIIKKTN